MKIFLILILMNLINLFLDDIIHIKGKLYLGNLNSIKYIDKYNINLVISIYDNPIKIKSSIKHLQFLIKDDLSLLSNLLLLKSWKIIIDLIKKEKGNVLIHCHYGLQRSASTILILLMEIYKLNQYQALQLIQKKRPLALYPENHFNLALKIFTIYNDK